MKVTFCKAELRLTHSQDSVTLKDEEQGESDLPYSPGYVRMRGEHSAGTLLGTEDVLYHQILTIYNPVMYILFLLYL